MSVTCPTRGRHSPGHRRHFRFCVALPFSTLLLFMAYGCAGTLTDEERAAFGDLTVKASTPTDCGQAILTRACASTDDVSQCKSCSGFPGCHGKDMPAVAGLDLSAAGLGDGSQYINQKADDSAMGSCGAGAVPTPVSGKVYIDPVHPESSLIYQKVTATFGCGLRMPYPGTVLLSDADQKCILDWIKSVPGVGGHADGGR